MIGKVGKILMAYYQADYFSGIREHYAQQICQLFEPKNNPAIIAQLKALERQKIERELYPTKNIENEPKPDEGRLLNRDSFEGFTFGDKVWGMIEPMLQAQRDLTASTGDAECQERVERILFETEIEYDGDGIPIAYLSRESQKALQKRELG